MKISKALLVIGFLVFSLKISAQENPELTSINSEIWSNFSTAFRNLDFELFESLHHPDFVRVNGNAKSVLTKDEYLLEYRINWKEEQPKLDIQFRFFERAYSKDVASERGVYKMIVNPGLEDERTFYGQFHVIIKKFDGSWKLIVDYDSNENGTIDAEEFQSAHKMEEFSRF